MPSQMENNQGVGFFRIKKRIEFLYSSSLKNIKQNRGATLFELVVLIIVIGIAIPAVLTVFGQMVIYNVNNAAVHRYVSLANSKMEEIVAFKQENDDWTDSISDFEISEDAGDGYTSTVTLTYLNNWLPTGKDGYQVDVKITHLSDPNGYKIFMIFAIE
jgi:type II secretory pathway pseudopilin PulG